MLCLPQRSRSQVILDGSWVAGRVPKWLINLWPNLACFSEIVDEDSSCSLTFRFTGNIVRCVLGNSAVFN